MNMSETCIPMAVFALATSITPGPVNVLSAISGARFGVLQSLAYVFGASSSFVIILVMVGLGLQRVMDLVERHAALMALAGGAYMLWLAWRIARDDGMLSIDGERQHRPGVVAGLLAQGANPKAWIVALSAISIYVAPHAGPGLRLAMFSAIYFVVCFMSLLVWVVLGAQLARFQGNIAWFNRIMALLLAASVLVMLTDVLGSRGNQLPP